MGFVDDNDDLPNNKVDRRPIPPGESATKFITAEEWNNLTVAAEETRDWIRAATWYGLAENAADPEPAGITNYVWLKDDGTLWKTVGGTASEIGAGGGTVTADGVTITGNGSVGDPLVAVDAGGWTWLTQAADQDVTNAQNQDSDTFTFAVAAGGTYQVQIDLYASSTNTTNDYQYRLAVAAGTMVGRGHSQGRAANDVFTNAALDAINAAETNSIPVGTRNGVDSTPTLMVAFFSFQPSDTTTFKLQFGNNVTDTGIVSRTWRGSIMRWKRLV